MARSHRGLQKMIYRLNTISNEYGMKINIGKTKVMKISKRESSRPTVKILISGEEIEQLKEFCYL